MMTKNLPSDEALKMFGYMRQAVKDTYFEKWLAAGGFEWPLDKVSHPRHPALGVAMGHAYRWAPAAGTEDPEGQSAESADFTGPDARGTYLMPSACSWSLDGTS